MSWFPAEIFAHLRLRVINRRAAEKWAKWFAAELGSTISGFEPARVEGGYVLLLGKVNEKVGKDRKLLNLL